MHPHCQLNKMAARTVFVYLAIFCVMQYSAAEELTMEQAMSQANAALLNLGSAIANMLTSEHAPNTQSVVDQLKTQSQGLGTKISEFVQQLHAQAQEYTGDFSQMIENMANKWNETATNLKAEHPEATQTAQEVQQQMTTALNRMYEDTKKLREDMQPHLEQAGESLKQLLRSALDTTIEQANNVREHLSPTAAPSK